MQILCKFCLEIHEKWNKEVRRRWNSVARRGRFSNQQLVALSADFFDENISKSELRPMRKSRQGDTALHKRFN